MQLEKDMTSAAIEMKRKTLSVSNELYLLLRLKLKFYLNKKLQIKEEMIFPLPTKRHGNNFVKCEGKSSCILPLWLRRSQHTFFKENWVNLWKILMLSM